MNTLSDYGITTIIAIDDIFNINKNTKLEDLQDHDRERIPELDDYYHDFSSEKVTVNDFFEENKYDSFQIADFWENFFPEDYYKKIKSENNVNFIECQPNNKEIEEKLSTLSPVEKQTDEKIFIILDKVLDSTQQESRLLLKNNLESINGVMLKNHNLFLVLFSSIPENFSEYNGVLDYLIDTIKVDRNCAKNLALHINFVDKKEYEINDFISALRKSQKANFVNSFNNVFEKSISSLKDKIWDINHNESLLHYDYLVEGQHIDTIIYEMFKSKFKYSYNEYRYTNYDKLINPVRNSIQKYEQFRITNDDLKIDLAPIKYRFLKYVNHAVYSKHTQLKISQSDDIAYGDIIEIGSKMYLVISQNCDITIRSDGKRKLNNFNLVEIKEVTKIIDIDWLKFEFKKYCDDSDIKFTQEEFKIFKNMFFLENEQTELEIMGFEKENLKKIEVANSYSNKNKYNEVVFSGKKELSRKTEYMIKSTELISIPCFWLDVLLLRKESNLSQGDAVVNKVDPENSTLSQEDVVSNKVKAVIKRNIVTAETIAHSKEIRLATKTFINNEFGNLLEKMKGIQKEAVDLSLENNLFNPVIPVEAIWEGNILKGFEILNVKREIHLDESKTRELHKKIIDSQVREAINMELLM